MDKRVKWTDEDTAKLKKILMYDKYSSITAIWEEYFIDKISYQSFRAHYKNMVGDDKWTNIDRFILNNARINNLPLDTIKSLFPGKTVANIMIKINRDYAIYTKTNEERKLVDGDCCIAEYASNNNKSRGAVTFTRIKYLVHQIIWTRRDLEIIQKYYPTMDAKLIKFRFFNDNDLITPPLINGAAYLLNVDKDSDHSRKKWTDEEISILMKYYPIGGSKLCNKYIERDVNSINVKAFKLGIKINDKARKTISENNKGRRYTSEEINTIKFFYPVLGPVNLHKTIMHNRSIQSIRQCAYRYGVYCNNTHDNLKDFIKKNILQCSTEELAERANVSEKSIKDIIYQMKKLGLLDL